MPFAVGVAIGISLLITRGKRVLIFLWVGVFALLLLTVCEDCLRHKIKNRNVLLTLILGIAILAMTPFEWHNLIQFIGGLLLGFAITIPFYIIKKTSAGDVKYFAVLSAILGLNNVLPFFILTTLSGGVMALMIIIANKEGISFMKRFFAMCIHAVAGGQLLYVEAEQESASAGMFPYALAIASGAVLTCIYFDTPATLLATATYLGP